MRVTRVSFSVLLSIRMQFSLKHSKRCNNVSSIYARTLSLASPSSARRCASSQALRPTTLPLILSIASTRFLLFCKQTKATGNTSSLMSVFALLVYLSFLFVLGGLSDSLVTALGVRTLHQDHPALVGPWTARPNCHNPNTCLLHVPHRLPIPRWLFHRSWDCPLMITFASLCFTAQVWLLYMHV
ncbi:hypothetical protein F5148DRAFT_1187786 [Russula earlei]|uniref:Uncharacterized protein n=1 Tax=Russula earlei TaxID=71964 RepID=A0ACC0UCE9_9AGAM|nr:hypothetical protein F5148DRAFT_1187786 [Russula earlei]